MAEENDKSKTRDNNLLCASIILQGLLASGHYTRGGVDNKDDPEIIRLDLGLEWQERGFPRRLVSLAICDALDLMLELKDVLGPPAP